MEMEMVTVMVMVMVVVLLHAVMVHQPSQEGPTNTVMVAGCRNNAMTNALVMGCHITPMLEMVIEQNLKMVMVQS